MELSEKFNRQKGIRSEINPPIESSSLDNLSKANRRTKAIEKDLSKAKQRRETLEKDLAKANQRIEALEMDHQENPETGRFYVTVNDRHQR